MSKECFVRIFFLCNLHKISLKNQNHQSLSKISYDVSYYETHKVEGKGIKVYSFVVHI